VKIRLTKRRLALSALGLLIPAMALWLSTRPSNDRRWSPDQAVLPWADVEGRLIHVHNIRNAVYRTAGDYDVHHYDKTFDLDRLRSVWFGMEPFSGSRTAAHTFVSFGFEGNQYLAVSVEIRKEVGETFSVIKGLLRQYEIMYVVGDERDLIKLRTNIRGDDVFLYPIRATRDAREKMLLSMLRRANRLRSEPELYNTLTNTCTTNIVRHVDEIAPGRIPWRYQVILPGFSDRFAYDLGLIDTGLSFEKARQWFRINERARKFADDPEFSARIREE